MTSTHCPECNRPFALVGRVHRCVPRPGRDFEVMQGRAARSAHVAHNHEVGGSNPPPATTIPSESKTGKTGMAGVKGPVRRSTAGSELRVGALDADPASVPAIPAPQVHPEGDPAGTQAIGAYKSAMCETPPSTGEAKHLHSTANRGEPAPVSNVVPIRKPKRDRAKYMRGYRSRKKSGGAA